MKQLTRLVKQLVIKKFPLKDRSGILRPTSTITAVLSSVEASSTDSSSHDFDDCVRSGYSPSGWNWHNGASPPVELGVPNL